MSGQIPESALSEFFSESEEILVRVNSTLGKLESQGPSDDLIDSLYRDIHTLKGSAQLFGFSGIGIIGHALEACLEPVRSKKLKLTEALVTQAYQSLDLIDKILKAPDKDLKKDPQVTEQIEILIANLITVATQSFQGNEGISHESIPTTEDLVYLKKELEQLMAPIKKTKEVILQTGSQGDKNLSNDKSSVNILRTHESKAVDQKVIKNQGAPGSSPEVSTLKPKVEAESSEGSNSETSTIRVQIGLLDRLMNLVGEMVLVRNQVLQHSQKTDDYEFLNLSQRLDLVTSELQEDVMKTRMQPIGSILTKFQRVVRDLSKELNKQIEFSVKGAETELDKSLLEAIKDPLTHIIRNSCDHGLESPEERRSAGKSEVGHVLVRAFHEGGQVVIEVSDDGRGLNLSKILAKAVQKKIVPTEKANSLSEREIAQLIFAPGFSTADQVSAISGRGVGMDVVKTNIEKVGGIVDLTSEMGKGTILRLRIPLTLAIVPAMIVQSRGQCFAIPQVKLQELVRVDMDGDGPKIEMLQGQPIYRLRGQLLPLVFINHVMNLNEFSKSIPPDSRILNIVVLSGEGDPFGLVVDEIRDTADIVVKPLPQFLKRLNVYSGATIMGDGSVSLILDVVGVAEKARIHTTTSKKEESLVQLSEANKLSFMESQEFLFFELNDSSRYCLPLILVQRLEEFSVNSIEVSGNERIVKYRNSILPIISLNDFFKIKPKPGVVNAEKISVIVISKRQRLFGIEVNQIFDVLRLTSEIEESLQNLPGVLGNIISGEHIATVIDVLGIIEAVIENETTTATGTRKSSKPKLPSSKKLNRRIRVLFAEDTPFFAKHVTKVLSDMNIDVVHAIDGADALSKLKNSTNEKFDLILSDIEMPNMNGFDFATAVRANAKWNQIPMIALTTRFRDADIKRGLACGFNQYLEKLKADQLIDAINNQLGGLVA